MDYLGCGPSELFGLVAQHAGIRWHGFRMPSRRAPVLRWGGELNPCSCPKAFASVGEVFASVSTPWSCETLIFGVVSRPLNTSEGIQSVKHHRDKAQKEHPASFRRNCRHFWTLISSQCKPSRDEVPEGRDLLELFGPSSLFLRFNTVTRQWGDVLGVAILVTVDICVVMRECDLERGCESKF